MATHSSILAWKIPWTEEPDGKELDRTEPLTCTCWVYLLPGKQDLAPRLFLTVCFSLVLHPLPSPTESAPCNPGKVLETERRVFPVIREMRNTERLCAREPHRPAEQAPKQQNVPPLSASPGNRLTTASRFS